MAEYFTTRDEAERFMREWYPKDKTPPVFFGKIFNNGAEKWIVNYDARQTPRSSPHIKVLEDHSNEIRQIVTSPHAQKQTSDRPPFPPPRAPIDEVGSTNLTLHSKYNVVGGANGTAQAVKENAFRAGEGVGAFITFVDSPPSLSVTDDHLVLHGRVKCSCGKEVSFEKTFYGARGGGETRCPSCSKGFGGGFHYSMSGYRNGFFVYFCPKPPGPMSLTIDDIMLIDGAKQREEEDKQRELRQQQERDRRFKQEQERTAALRQRRIAEGKCVQCGEHLGFLNKVLRRSQHRNCSEASSTNATKALQTQHAATPKPGVGRDAAAIIEDLRSTDNATRSAAAKELSERDWPESAVDMLASGIGDQDLFIRRAVAEALIKTQSYAAGKPLNTLVADEDWQLRVEVARALEKWRWQKNQTTRQWVQMNVALENAAQTYNVSDDKKYECFEPLIEIMRDKNMRARCVAAEALGMMRDTRAIPVLANGLGDESSVVRMHSAMSLGEMDHANVVKPLLMALGDQDVRVRREAAVALGKSGESRALEALRELAATDIEDEVRSEAQRAVEMLGADPLDQKLFRALQRNDIDVVIAQGPAAIPYLESLVRQNKDGNIRNAAARSIGRIGGHDAVIPLSVAIVDEDQKTRIAAIMALAKIDDDGAIGLLIGALRDDYWMNREEAAKGLGLRGDRRAIGPLREITSDADSYVREAAHKALQILERGW